MSLIKIVKKIKDDFKQISIYPKCSYGSEYAVDYNVFWKKRRGGSSTLSSWQKQRADWTLKTLDPSSTVLDIGWRDGDVLDYLNERGGHKSVEVNIDENILKLARNLGIENVKINFSDFDQIRNLPEVDYILGFEIIEHLPNPETFIYYLVKKAKKGLIFSVPNSGYYIHRLRFLFGRFPLQWLTHPGEHLRFWTVKDMDSWLKSLGLKNSKITLYEGVPILNRIFPNLFAQGMIVFVECD
ncbi:class I SAM-dependent methyltransferase [Patescibacteria group bacterium]|nr:class I SAM-dependent methyltransferase [Patescibacteria group bacterium]